VNRLYIVFFILFVSSCVLFTGKITYAQDLIRFADGKELKCKIEGVTDTTAWFSYQKGKRNKDEVIFLTDIFSLVYGDTLETVVYKPDTTDSLSFNIEQMRSYVAGAAFARRNYKGNLSTVGGFLAGAGGGLLGFWGLTIPLTYDLLVGFLAPQPRNYRKERKPEVVDDFFVLGYQDVAQKKKARKIIFSSITGAIIIGVYTTVRTQ